MNKSSYNYSNIIQKPYF